MSDYNYEITERIAVLSKNRKGWTKELNMVSWNGQEPKYDIRPWSPDHTQPGKGVTLDVKEMMALVKAVSWNEDEEKE